MEKELRANLICCAQAFVAVRKVSMGTLGRLAAGDWRFFDHLGDETKTFTARKYDETILWLSTNWPENAVWPDQVARPQQVSA